jgi:putative phage-type endonuclease
MTHYKSQNLISRSQGIGGSDIGAILGLSPYRSAVDVWLEKVGRQGPHNDAVHLRYGHHLEPFVAQEYERVTGHKTHEYPETLRHPEHPHLYAHVDRLVSVDGEPVTDASGRLTAKTLLECKTASAFTASSWGAEWTDEVPPAYLAQCVWYMELSGCEEGHLAVLLGNSDFRVYRVQQDRELAAFLIDRALRFWDEHVVKRVAPVPTTRKEVDQLYPAHQKGMELEADPELLRKIEQLRRLQRIGRRLDERCAELTTAVTSMMGEAERVSCSGRTLATWRTSSPSNRLDVTRLRREQPDIVSRYTLQGSPSRRFTLMGDRDE